MKHVCMHCRVTYKTDLVPAPGTNDVDAETTGLCAVCLEKQYPQENELCSLCGLDTDVPLGTSHEEWHLCSRCVGSPAAIAAGYAYPALH